jgi:hypothetical protein
MKFFESHNILSDKQHGFRKKRSCESQLMIRVSDGVIDVAISFKKRVDSWSGPVALCGLRLRSSFRTPSFPIIIFGASGVLLVPKFGMVLVFSLVKTKLVLRVLIMS